MGLAKIPCEETRKKKNRHFNQSGFKPSASCGCIQMLLKMHFLGPFLTGTSLLDWARLYRSLQ